MADPTAIYIRGGFFPEEVPSPEDLQALLRLSVAQVQAAAQSLADHVGFLSWQAAGTRIRSALGEDQEQAANVLVRITRSIRAHQERAGTAYDTRRLIAISVRSRPDSGEAKSSFSSEQSEELVERLRLLEEKFPGVELQEKAERLVQSLPRRCEAVDLLCDLRPVFNNDRDRVEGVIPLTTLRVVSVGVDLFPHAVDVTLSAKMVLELQEKVNAAVKKLNVLGQLTEQFALPIPDLDMTRPGKNTK